MLNYRQPTRRPLLGLDVRNVVIGLLVVILFLQFYVMTPGKDKHNHNHDDAPIATTKQPMPLAETNTNTNTNTQTVPAPLRSQQQYQNQHNQSPPPVGQVTITTDAPNSLPIDNSRRFNVLYWEAQTLNFLSDYGTGHLEDGCPMTNCYFSTDRSTLSQSQAVIFHIPNFDSFPPSKPDGQVWVSLSLESDLQYSRLADKEFMSHFDWTGVRKLHFSLMAQP